MKVSKITNGLLVSLLLSATVVVADSKYPATDFQPKVVYQDSDYKHSSSSKSSSSKSSREVSAADSNYPAANFQPEVLYQDKGYKHSKDKASASSSSKSVSVETDSQSAAVESDDSPFSMLLGLMIVAVAGFLFYKKGNTTSAPARRRAPSQASVVASSDSEGLSGVSKYLESKAGPLVSGVAKYLEERESVSVSGVAKYVAKQKVSARQAEAENVSGVEKYLKDRG